MMRTNRLLNNCTGGILSPVMRGRVDLGIYNKSLGDCNNFFILAQGGVKYRLGTMFVKYTRTNQKAVFIPFQFSDQQSYLIEVTKFKMRFYKDNGIILETAKTVTAITKANPGVVSSTAHGFANGDEVYLTAAGMTQVNGKYFIVANKTADTFELKDVFGSNVNTTAYDTFTSGTAARVYEIAAPWDEDHLPYIQFAQSADTMYLVNQNYEPRKLSRTGHTAWTLATYSRTADPFTPTTATITGITQANPGVVTAVAHGYSNGDIVHLSAVVGMTEVNSCIFVVTNKAANTFELYDLYGNKVNTTAYTAYGSAGTVTNTNEWPRAVTFTDAGRLVFGGTKMNPETIWGSKAPSTGTTAFDNFTTGTSATDAVIFTLAPIHGKVDAIQWLSNTAKFIIIGTFGAIRRAYGATEQEAITPTGFTAKSVNAYGCAPTLPVSNGSSMFYVQRASKRLRSLEYDISIDGYTTIDRTLVSEHLTKNGISRIVEQQGDQDFVWAIRNDGKLLCLTYKEREDISGWHRHYIGGSHTNDSGLTKDWGKVISISPMPRATNSDQIWFIVERVINGHTVRCVEYMADEPNYPNMEDFFSDKDPDSEEDDKSTFNDVMFETQKGAVHLDMAASYDGTVYGSSASATVTPGATEGDGVTFTASAAVFTSAMVGREIWKKYDENGDGGGRAKIVTFTDSTHVVCDIKSNFNNASAIAAGSWFLTTDSITGLDHLEGLTVKVIRDGGTNPDVTVANGAITLPRQASKAHVGIPYTGVIESLNIDPGGQTGPSEAKVRSIRKIAFGLQNSLGLYFGTTRYNTERLIFQNTGNLTDRPPPPFNGVKEQNYIDDPRSDEKQFTVIKDTPLPLTLLFADLFLVTNENQ